LVSEFEIKKVPISLIKFDETNPNVLSDQQMIALKLTMEKYGYLSPVILNKDFTVIDGEHRVRIYQELNQEQIPAYVLDVDIVDQKILRQLMNKLRGEHDPVKDSNEFDFIEQKGKIEELMTLLGKSDIDLINKNDTQIPTDNKKIDFDDVLIHRCIVDGCSHGQEE
jgi:ParB-like chromosome segregation protein Spo0J